MAAQAGPRLPAGGSERQPQQRHCACPNGGTASGCRYNPIASHSTKCSGTLPPNMRSIVSPVQATRLPVGATPIQSPRWVPAIVRQDMTRRPPLSIVLRQTNVRRTGTTGLFRRYPGGNRVRQRLSPSCATDVQGRTRPAGSVRSEGSSAIGHIITNADTYIAIGLRRRTSFKSDVARVPYHERRVLRLAHRFCRRRSDCG